MFLLGCRFRLYSLPYTFEKNWCGDITGAPPVAVLGGFDERDTDPESLVVKDKRFLWSNPIKVNKSSIKSELVRIWPMRSESKSNLSKIAAGFSGNWIQRNRKHKPKMKTKYRYCSCLHEWEITLNTEWRAKDRVYQLLSKAELYPENIRQSIFLTHYNAFCSLLR